MSTITLPVSRFMRSRLPDPAPLGAIVRVLMEPCRRKKGSPLWLLALDLHQGLGGGFAHGLLGAGFGKLLDGGNRFLGNGPKHSQGDQGAVAHVRRLVLEGGGKAWDCRLGG